MKLMTQVATRLGTRDNQEDVGHVEPGKVFTLLVVCDGMGGHDAGDVAARLAVKSLVAVVKPKLNKDWARDERVSKMTLALMAGVAKARDAVGEMAHGRVREPGTTLVAAIVPNDGCGPMVVVNVGDSRAYWGDGSGVQGQITVDHDMRPPHGNVLTSCIPGVKRMDYHVVWADNSQAVLALCSDGVFDERKLPEMDRMLGVTVLNGAEKALDNLALEAPFRDNATLVVARWA